MIRLQPLNQTNARAVVRLSIAHEQHEFVASNADSIADAYVDRSLQPLAIYAGDELVGFTMYGLETETGRWWVIRLMIDERFQRRGYSRAAMLGLIDLMREQHGCRSMVLGVDAGNEGAIRLYEGLGFSATGEVEHDETIMRLDLGS
ncbi:MAG: GNAT family N-acetyltransferase [Chloroflexota bacterium]|nr:GNAT family N-acetyltransferase [Chloroflexota bacterium]